MKTIKVGDLVCPSAWQRTSFEYGVVLDIYEDDYGILYYEVHWGVDTEWWKEGELELVSEGR